ncbi:MAG TPA: molybdopterin-binding protein, partial [Bryobacteraceae bacterium]|nr:molybdopterin-binding protein [Bryobacteraceae bacterium]
MITVAIVTVSDSAVQRTRPDLSGPKLRERVEALGWTVTAQELVPDETDQIAAVIRRVADSGRASVI